MENRRLLLPILCGTMKESTLALATARMLKLIKKEANSGDSRIFLLRQLRRITMAIILRICLMINRNHVEVLHCNKLQLIHCVSVRQLILLVLKEVCCLGFKIMIYARIPIRSKANTVGMKIFLKQMFSRRNSQRVQSPKPCKIRINQLKIG